MRDLAARAVLGGERVEDRQRTAVRRRPEQVPHQARILRELLVDACARPVGPRARVLLRQQDGAGDPRRPGPQRAADGASGQHDRVGLLRAGAQGAGRLRLLRVRALRFSRRSVCRPGVGSLPGTVFLGLGHEDPGGAVPGDLDPHPAAAPAVHGGDVDRAAAGAGEPLLQSCPAARFGLGEGPGLLRVAERDSPPPGVLPATEGDPAVLDEPDDEREELLDLLRPGRGDIALRHLDAVGQPGLRGDGQGELLAAGQVLVLEQRGIAGRAPVPVDGVAHPGREHDLVLLIPFIALGGQLDRVHGDRRGPQRRRRTGPSGSVIAPQLPQLAFVQSDGVAVLLEESLAGRSQGALDGAPGEDRTAVAVARESPGDGGPILWVAAAVDHLVDASRVEGRVRHQVDGELIAGHSHR